MPSMARAGGAVVTGAGGGLGREIALRPARRGFTVQVTDLEADLAARHGPRRGQPLVVRASRLKQRAVRRRLTG